MAARLDNSLQAPPDVEVSWDMDGCSLKLPGPRTNWLESARLWLLLSLGTGAFMLPFAFLAGDGLHRALMFSLFASCAQALLSPLFLMLGAIALRNGGVSVRIEPRRTMSYRTFGMDGPAEVSIPGITEIVVLDSGAPRLCLSTSQGEKVVRLRSHEHARFLARALQLARPDSASEDDVPAAIHALRQPST